MPFSNRLQLRLVLLLCLGEYFAFTGPLNDNQGNQVLAAGEIADRMHLDTINYYVEGIDATVPN